MKSIVTKFGLALILALCFAQIATAEIMVGTSVEWLAASSNVVAVGVLEQTTEEKGLGSVIYESYKLKISKTLKGNKKQKEIDFVVRVVGRNSRIKEIAKSKELVIAFLSKTNGHSTETFLNNKFVPTNKLFPLSIINLDKPSKYVIDTNFKVLKEKKKIIGASKKALKLMQKFLKKDSNNKLERRVVEVPLDSEAFASLYGGSVCYLTVPNFIFPDAKKSIFEELLK